MISRQLPASPSSLYYLRAAAALRGDSPCTLIPPSNVADANKITTAPTSPPTILINIRLSNVNACNKNRTPSLVYYRRRLMHIILLITYQLPSAAPYLLLFTQWSKKKTTVRHTILRSLLNSVQLYRHESPTNIISPVSVDC